ncbi:MAG TPA: GNAT family N-acetyltransferase [Candidatus Hodarchaeales archaeon]|nr:GNAT family N-acetyltransferase [Candidatus Hodarchaeales archaeon]
MKVADFGHVRELWKNSGISLSLSDQPEELAKMLERNPDLCLVCCETGGKIIGAVLGGFDGRRGWVHHLAVSSDFRHLGIGTMIMKELQGRFEHLCTAVKLKLEVVSSNMEVIAFYKQLGWDERPELVTMTKTLRD